MIVPLGVAWMLVSSGRTFGWAVLATALLGIGLMASESLAACLAVVLSCTLMLVLARRPLWAGAVGLVTTSLLTATLLFSSAARSAPGAVLESRWELWTRALYLFQELAFTGAGAGSFGTAANRLYPFLSTTPDHVYPHAHNLVLQVAAEMGVGGLTAFTILVSLCLFRASGLVIRPQTDESHLTLGFFCGLISHLLHGLFDSPLWMNRPMPLLFLFLGVLAWRGAPPAGSYLPVIQVLAGWSLVALVGLVAVTYNAPAAILLILAGGAAVAFGVESRSSSEKS